MADESLKLELCAIGKSEIWALAQMVKRIHYSDMRSLSASDEEADAMATAVTKLQKALDDAGYSPR